MTQYVGATSCDEFTKPSRLRKAAEPEGQTADQCTIGRALHVSRTVTVAWSPNVSFVYDPLDNLFKKLHYIQ